MKKQLFFSFLLIATIVCTLPASSQIRKIPAEVTQALKDKYPNADNVSWKDKLTSFSASFEMGNERYEARFSDKGVWRSTEKEISENDIPAEVKDGFGKSKYADWELKNAFFIQLPEDATQYRILVAKSDIQKKNLLFNSDGKLLKDNITLK